MTWVTTSGRTGCRGLQGLLLPESIYAIVPFPVAFHEERPMALGHYGSRRGFPAKPARQRRCPCGLRGLTAQRAQASGYHAKNTEKRSLGPGIDPTEPRGELGF